MKAKDDAFIPRLPLDAVEKLKRGTTIMSKKKYTRKTKQREIDEQFAEKP